MLGVTTNKDRLKGKVADWSFPKFKDEFAARAHNPSPKREDSVSTTPYPWAQVPHINYLCCLLLFSHGIRIAQNT